MQRKSQDQRANPTAILIAVILTAAIPTAVPERVTLVLDLIPLDLTVIRALDLIVILTAVQRVLTATEHPSFLSLLFPSFLILCQS